MGLILECSKSITIPSACPKCPDDSFKRDGGTPDKYSFAAIAHQVVKKVFIPSPYDIPGNPPAGFWSIIPTCSVDSFVSLAGGGAPIGYGVYVPGSDDIYIGSVGGIVPVDAVTGVPGALIAAGGGQGRFMEYAAARGLVYVIVRTSGPTASHVYALDPITGTTALVFNFPAGMHPYMLSYAENVDALFGTWAGGGSECIWKYDFATSTFSTHQYLSGGFRIPFAGLAYDPSREVLWVLGVPTGPGDSVYSFDITVTPPTILYTHTITQFNYLALFDRDLDRFMWGIGPTLYQWNPNTNSETWFTNAAYDHPVSGYPCKMCDQYYWPATNAAVTECGVRVLDISHFT